MAEEAAWSVCLRASWPLSQPQDRHVESVSTEPLRCEIQAARGGEQGVTDRHLSTGRQEGPYSGFRCLPGRGATPPHSPTPACVREGTASAAPSLHTVYGKAPRPCWPCQESLHSRRAGAVKAGTPDILHSSSRRLQVHPCFCAALQPGTRALLPVWAPGVLGRGVRGRKSHQRAVKAIPPHFLSQRESSLTRRTPRLSLLSLDVMCLRAEWSLSRSAGGGDGRLAEVCLPSKAETAAAPA